MGHPPSLFPHHWGAGGGQEAEARGGLLAPIFWAVAGKGYSPLFSPSPSALTNPAEGAKKGGKGSENDK